MTGRLLVAYSNSANYVATTAEYLAAFAKHSSWDVRYLHVTHDAEPDVDLADYDAVLQSYCVRPAMDLYVPDAWMEKFKAFQGVKAVALQDEYDRVNRTIGWMRDIGTCYRAASWMPPLRFRPHATAPARAACRRFIGARRLVFRSHR